MIQNLYFRLMVLNFLLTQISANQSFKVSLFIVFVLAAPSLSAQSKLNFQRVDTNTYEFYANQQWDSLISLANKAINQNIDYFYLRVRVGYAYFMKRDYNSAIEHFKVANNYNSGDPFVIECLYYSYLFLNRPLEANFIIKSNKNVLSKTSIKRSILNFLYLEGSAASSQYKKNMINIPNSPWNEISKTNAIYYSAAGAQFGLGKRALSVISYSKLLLDKEKTITIGNTPHKDQYYLFQHQFYTNFSLRINEQNSFTTAINYIIVNYNTIFSEFNQANQQYDVREESKRLMNYAASIAYKYRLNKLDWTVDFVLSNLNKQTQQSVGTSFIIYPRGNLDFYFSSAIHFLSQSNSRYYIFNLNTGFKLANHLWIEPFVRLGEFFNYTENNAYVIFNTEDKSKYCVGSEIIIPSPKFKFSIRYSYDSKSTPYEFYDNQYRARYLDYNQHQIILNLTRLF